MVKYPKHIWNIIISYLIYDYRNLDNILFKQRCETGKYISYDNKIRWALWWRSSCNHNRRQHIFPICNTILNSFYNNKNKINKIKRKRHSYLTIYNTPKCDPNICDKHCHLLCNGDCSYLCPGSSLFLFDALERGLRLSNFYDYPVGV